MLLQHGSRLGLGLTCSSPLSPSGRACILEHPPEARVRASKRKENVTTRGEASVPGGMKGDGVDKQDPGEAQAKMRRGAK